MKKYLLILSLAVLHPGFSQENAPRPLAARKLATQIEKTEALVAAPVMQVVARPNLKAKPLPEGLKAWAVIRLKNQDLKAELPADFDKGTIESLDSGLNDFIVKPKTIETRVMDSSRVIELPGVVVSMEKGSPVSSGSGEDGIEVLNFTVFASPLPAIWDIDKESYSTKVTFGLKSSKGAASRFSLPEPVQVRVAFDGLAGEEPEPLVIEGVGFEKEESFFLEFKPTTDAPKLLVRSTISDVDLKLKAVSRLLLQATRKEILGFGLEEVVFNVSEFQPHGKLVENEVQVPIGVSVSGRGSMEPEQPIFDVGAAASQFKVRSSGVGAMDVEVRVGDSVAVASVVQAFPLSPLLAVLFGGALGGFARRFVKGAGAVRVPRWILEGVIVSLIAFVAGVLGVGSLGIPSAIVATEAGAFLVGAISGFAGVVTLEKITSSFGKS